MPPDPLRSLRLRLSFRKTVSIYPRSAPALNDVSSAPLFIDAVSIFVACAVEFQVGVLPPKDFSVSNLHLRRLTIRRSC